MKTIEEQFLTSSDKPTTEFEIQADCYQYLKQNFPLVRGEIKIQHEKTSHLRRSRGARFDLVVYQFIDNMYVPIFTLEVKRTEKRLNTKRSHYESLSGVPCYTIGSLVQCKDLVSRLYA